MSRARRPALWRQATTLVLGLALGGVGLALSLRGVSWLALAQALRGVQRSWLTLAVLASASVAALKAARWYGLFLPHHRDLEFPALAATLIVAQMVNVVVPIHGGAALRIGRLTRRFPVSALRVSGTIVLEKLLDVGSLSLLGLAAAPVTAQLVGRPLLSRAALLAAGAAGPVGSGPPAPGPAALRRLRPWPCVAGWVDQLLSGFNALQSGALAWEPAAWTAAVRCLSFVSLIAALSSAGVRLSLVGIVALDVLLNPSYLLPTPPALIGLVQAVTVLVLGRFGIAGVATVGTGMVLHLTTLAPYLVFGLPAGVYVWAFSLIQCRP